ncbi:MAG: CHASE2 domain-containing protein [Burkholderiales bacterium]|nr:CHASE2 domain-containing protein [Burkholderiales bacterium]
MPGLIALASRALRSGRGRWGALLLLALLCVPIALPYFTPFPGIGLAWFDLYQRAMPRQRLAGPVTIVEIDAESLRTLGQWPWPRTRLARLIERIGKHGARAIGIDIVMPEPDQTSPEALLGRLDEPPSAVVDALAAMPRNDSVLTETIKRHPVVLGAAGFDAAAPSTTVGLRTWPLVRGGELIGAALRHYPYALVSLPPFQAAASGQGLLSVDLERGVLRRVPLVSTVGAAMVPAFSLELVRVAIEASPIEVETRAGEVAALRVGELRVPAQPSGEAWIHFSRSTPDRYVSALGVLSDRVQSNWFKDKIVIIALTGLGLVDYKTTPLGEYVPGVEAHAQLIESFFDGRHLQRPAWLPAAEAAAFALLAAVLIWAVPVMRRYLAVFLWLALSILVCAIGFGAFAWSGLLVDAANMLIALFLVFASLIAAALAQADHDRRASQQSLRAAREAAARVAGELEAARRIQLGILPRSEASFAGEARFELAAAIEPARAVGGDLYDFFMLDSRHLFLHVADVSGKGLPASLLMAITKVLMKSIALRAAGASEGLLTQANVEISRDNPESHFVTAFAAVLDVDQGELRYWTAGHDTPFVLDAGSACQLDRSGSGPPLSVLPDYRYPQQRHRLAPGSLLVLFTDGVSEAEDPAGGQYGKERLLRCLTRLPPDTSAQAALAAIHADVTRFVAGAPASDDLTLVVLRWLGSRRD